MKNKKGRFIHFVRERITGIHDQEKGGTKKEIMSKENRKDSINLDKENITYLSKLMKRGSEFGNRNAQLVMRCPHKSNTDAENN